MRVASLAFLLVTLLTGHALAWGPEGHRIVADIAEQYLQPDTAREVRALLAIENAATLAEVSTWAGEIRTQRPETAAWLFVNIPIHPEPGTPSAYDPARDCPRGDCVVAAIDRFAAVLRDKAVPPSQRLEALKFLVHFVADVHQPLDCADNGDRGGNETHLTFLGRVTNLHALWDSDMLEAAGIGDEHAYALRLAKSIPAARLAQWRAGTAVDWANESYGIGRLIYGGSHEARALAIFYEEDLLPVINIQLEKAGLRLAVVLNTALP